MASKGDTFENDLLKLIFQNVTIATIGDATGIVGSTTAGSLFFNLHTADPGETGNQTTSVISYTPYASVGVARSAGGFSVSGNTVSLVATVSFAQMTSGTGGSAGFFSVGAASSGTGKILYYGTVSPAISVTTNVTPQLQSLTITED